MQGNFAVMICICFLLCHSFNYTVPLQRGNAERSPVGSFFGNHAHFCSKNVHPDKNINRSKKMAMNIENVVKKIRDSTQEIGKNIYEHLNTDKRSDDKHKLSEKDLRQYEQLVRMKKYPYLDIKELELKYNPSAYKTIRQNVNFASGSHIGGDPSLRESIDEGPCVEINNRGLSGFAIPARHSKIGNTAEQHISNVNVKIPQVNSFKNIGKLPKDFRILSDIPPDAIGHNNLNR